MKILPNPKRSKYIEKYPIHSLFSFPITDLIQVRQYERGEFIIQEGSYPEYLFYLVEGKAKIYLTHQNGKKSLINFIEPGTFIGEIELLHAEYYSKGIQTGTKAICLAIPVHACKEELLNDVTFLKYLCTFLSNKATIMAAKYSESRAYPLENRLAEFILMSSDANLYKEKHTEVCEYLGVSYRHLLHVFSQFCQLGYIEKNGRGFTIINETKLQNLATSVHLK